MSETQEQVLSLNLEDRAAQSILYAYVAARGVESTSPHTDDVLALAELLNSNPNPLTNTAMQDWRQFISWVDLIVGENDPGHSCTIQELELCMKGTGYEVAAVVLRALPEDEKESWRKDLNTEREARGVSRWRSDKDRLKRSRRK